MMTLQELLAMLQGGPLSQLPSERQGVRPGYGLAGARIQTSDLMDKLRQPDNWKSAAMPMTPGGAIPSGAFNLKYGSRIMKGATATPTVSSISGRTAYNLHTPKGEYIETLSEKELLRMIEAAK